MSKLEMKLPDLIQIERQIDPLEIELFQWYDRENIQSFIKVSGIVKRLAEMKETPDRIRSFLLSRQKKPPLPYFIDDFLDWQQRNPNQMRFVNYQEYLKSDEWKHRREKHLRLAENRCQVCNSDSELHLHHRTYDRLGCERFADLIALCRDCHALFHDKLPHPR